jgi:hypothetical protein
MNVSRQKITSDMRENDKQNRFSLPLYCFKLQNSSVLNDLRKTKFSSDEKSFVLRYEKACKLEITNTWFLLNKAIL